MPKRTVYNRRNPLRKEDDLAKSFLAAYGKLPNEAERAQYAPFYNRFVVNGGGMNLYAGVAAWLPTKSRTA